MHDSAGVDVIFVTSWKWSFLKSLCKRDLESVQEENCLLPCVHEYFASSGQEGLVFHKCSKIKVNVNIEQFSCPHGCDQFAHLG